MKILRISHIFALGAFQELFRKFQITYRDKSYQEELEGILKLKIDNCAALSRELKKLGFEVSDIYYDLESLQKKWAMEYSVQFQEQKWQVDIVAKQIEHIRPDIVFIQKSALGMQSFLENLRKNFPFIKLVVVHSAYLGATGNLGYADLLLAGTPSLVNRFRFEGLKPELFYHYFDEEILTQDLSNEENTYDLTFLGTSGYGQGYMHAERYFLLRKLIEESKLELWLHEIKYSGNKLDKARFRYWLKKLVGSLSPYWIERLIRTSLFSGKLSAIFREVLLEKEYQKREIFLPDKGLITLFPNRCYPAVIGMDYYRVMANSKISFHKQGGSVVQPGSEAKGNIGALRLFEATGLGSCLVADSGPNMGDLFEEGTEIVTYSSEAEALDKIKLLLGNESKRKEIAQAGQKRTLRDHTAGKRAGFLSALIREKLKQ